MSFVLLGILNSQAAGGVSVTYRLQLLDGAGANDQPYAIAIDSQNNILAFGITNTTGAGNRDHLLVKYDSEGTIQFQKVLGLGLNDYGYGVDTDSADNIYTFGYAETSPSNNDCILAKYNSTGTLQWQRALGSSGDDRGFGVKVDSADDIYVVGYTDSTGAGSDDFLIAKYNSAGTIVWQRTLGGASFDQAEAIFVDSSDNILVAGRTNSTGEGNNDFLIAKYNSSGTLQWQRTLGVTASGTAFDSAYGIATDSSDNVYVAGMAQIGSNTLIIAKYNSSGTLQWQRSLGDSNVQYGRSVTVDSADNVYVAGYENASGINDFLIAKYDSSGTIQWQRTLGSGGGQIGYSITCDAGDNLYVIGESNEGAGINWLIAVLPNDGSLTATYVLNGVNFVYGASSFTDASSSLTGSTSSLSSQTSSLTSSTSSLTSGTAALTDYRVDL